MTIISAPVPTVTPEPGGAALHAALVAEATVGLRDALAAGPSSPEELAAVLDAAIGGTVEEATLSVLAYVLSRWPRRAWTCGAEVPDL